MERDLMFKQQVTQQTNQVWRYGEKPAKSKRVAQSSKIMTQSAPNIAQSAIQNKKFTRDDINTRMGDRDLFVQVGVNPFLSNNNYINDIVNRDQYLLARDSNFN